VKWAKHIGTVIVGGSVVLGFFVVLGLVIWKGESSDIKALMIGTLCTAFGLVVGYFFGSTAASERKTEMLARAGPIEHKE
jgi:hypothetical protein